jgi:hypothetical protein
VTSLGCGGKKLDEVLSGISACETEGAS